MSVHAVCSDCTQHMDPGVSCIPTHVAKGEKTEPVARIRVGEDGDWTEVTCHDCNAPVGGIHHGGCDTERCPGCGGQMMGCLGEIDLEDLGFGPSCGWQYLVTQEAVQ